MIWRWVLLILIVALSHCLLTNRLLRRASSVSWSLVLRAIFSFVFLKSSSRDLYRILMLRTSLGLKCFLVSWVVFWAFPFNRLSLLSNLQKGWYLNMKTLLVIVRCFCALPPNKSIFYQFVTFLGDVLKGNSQFPLLYSCPNCRFP